MQRDFQTLRDAVMQDVDKMEHMGEDVARFFEGMSNALEEDFGQTLERTLSEVRKFEQEVSRSFSSGSLGSMGNVLGDVLGDALATALPDSLWGNAFGSALSGAMKSTFSQLLGKGDVNMRSVLGAANRSASSTMNAAYGKTPAQQAADEARRLENAQRNL